MPHARASSSRDAVWSCEVQSKNTLDAKYLEQAERPSGGHCTPADIRTLAEVTGIEHDGKVFTVTYNDLLFRPEGGRDTYQTECVTGDYVFLCAGAVNTTELLLKQKNTSLFGQAGAGDTPLGSHYFPNADTLGAVFNCDLPHEADYGPTITSAVLYHAEARGDFSRSLDFLAGSLQPGQAAPVAGDIVTSASNGTAVLAHDPVLDWGDWKRTAAGCLVLTNVAGEFKPGDWLDIGGKAKAEARTGLIAHEHWFLVQDGGYPPSLEPLVGIFKSPVWMRRNRYVEFTGATAPPPQRRPVGQQIMLQSFANSFGGTSQSIGSGAARSSGRSARSSCGPRPCSASSSARSFLPGSSRTPQGQERTARVGVRPGSADAQPPAQRGCRRRSRSR